MLTFDEVTNKYRKGDIEEYKNCEVHAYLIILLIAEECLCINQKSPFGELVKPSLVVSIHYDLANSN